MRNFVKIAVSVGLGHVLGLAATYYSVDRGLGFGAVRAGPWTAWPRAGSAEIDPYARASLSRTGEVPLGLAEGLSFVAAADTAGNALQGDCSYTLSGNMPPARYWTISVVTRDGRLAPNNANRHGFTSSEILRRAGGAFSIVLARDAQPGNWLPTGDANAFLLVLRAYDSPVSATASALTEKGLPAIDRVSCQ